jgi:hypothetical protein
LRRTAITLLKEDEEMLAWWGTPVEIASALARRERERAMTADEVAVAMSLVKELSDGWHEIVPSPAVRVTAQRMLRVHPLRAADSLQLAAALIELRESRVNIILQRYGPISDTPSHRFGARIFSPSSIAPDGNPWQRSNDTTGRVIKKIQSTTSNRCRSIDHDIVRSIISPYR